MGDYKTEDEIMDAYGYEYITEKEKEQLLNDLRATSEAGQSALDEKTALTEYLRMLRQDVRSINTEIREIKEELQAK